MPSYLLPLLLIGPILLLLALGIVGILVRDQRQRLQQEREKQQLLAQQNELLEQQVAARTAEVVAQRNSLEETLLELRNTQTQLVQREKMASLGELTAGIAHEIQNPLNFVNNFSEVSSELIAELEAESSLGPRSALAAELIADLKQNLLKITQHGQRAAAIVRGMLEHSRASTGEWVTTDLNLLCEEHLQLAYQSARARNKALALTLTTHFDPALPPLRMVPQEIGRVLLNLFLNAFYAVEQRQRQASPPGYQPQISVSTHPLPHHALIRVRDNGTGIPEAIQAKIFQPFFTTKPAGEGTGLGLSLSFDIVAKGHGGTLTVESREGEFTEFSICLPTAAAEENLPA